MDIQEINQRIDTLTEELEKLKTLKESYKVKNFDVNLVFHFDPSTPDTIYLHTEKGEIPVKSIRNLVGHCMDFPAESPIEAFFKGLEGTAHACNRQV